MRYVPSRRLALAAKSLRTIRGVAAILLEGPPGVGKTSFGEWLAESEHMTLVYHQCHAWTDSDELFVGVDVAAAVAGDAAAVRQDGVLARVARLSQERRVLAILDEVTCPAPPWWELICFRLPYIRPICMGPSWIMLT